MKRSDVIKKLISEGVSEKTLSKFTDKQLKLLASRIIKEQSYGSLPQAQQNKLRDTVKIGAKNSQLKSVQDFASKSKLPVEITPENELTELFADEGEDEATLNVAKGGGYKEIGKKIISFQSKEKDFNAKNLPYKIAIPEHLPFQLSNGNYHHSYCVKGYMGDSESDEVDSIGELYEMKNWIKKSVGVPKDNKISEKKLNSESKEGKKIGQKARLSKTLKNLNETKKWVEKLVEQDSNTMTTKNEIINLVRTKLKEQAEPIAPPKPKEPKTRPGTKPGTRPRPDEDDDPYIDPFEPAHGPGTEPKFEKKNHKLSDDFKMAVLKLIGGSKSDFISSSLNENKKSKSLIKK